MVLSRIKTKYTHLGFSSFPNVFLRFILNSELYFDYKNVPFLFPLPCPYVCPLFLIKFDNVFNLHREKLISDGGIEMEGKGPKLVSW